jgi:hypothetical protein
MTRRSPDVTRPNPSQPNHRLTRCQIQDFKHKLARAVRVMVPTLIALTFASAAHAQGTMDFSSATTLMGTFKTQLIMQILRQIRERGDSAIVYDPACEYLQRFYDPKRGDIVLNPLDERCPYWGPAQEMASNAEADAIAASLYQPATDVKDEFFHQTPAQIFAHLLKKGPTPHQLAEWMANSDTLETLVAGTEMSFYIDRKAGPQRAGVLASLGLVAKCFRILPEKWQTSRTWNARTWAKERKGWIFITSHPAERETLRPLHSLWIDLLVMRLLSAPQPDQKPVWFVIDD